MSTEPPSASSRPAISSSAITSFLTLLPHSFLLSSPNTYLPTRFPLAFPTPTHSLNLLTTLHLVHATLSDPSHSTYFAETRSCPADTALRGILGLYLASDARWGRENLLSATAWRGGLLDDEKVGEFFGIEVMREREHEALRGVKVGERWSEGVGVVQSLVGLFREVGERLTGDCVGDAVRRATEQAGEGVGSVHEFARVFSQDVVALLPHLADPASQPESSAIPAAPLRLLLDLAYRNTTDPDPDLRLPKHDDLANISPLPLSIPILLHLGIIDLPPSADEGLSHLRRLLAEWKEQKLDLFASASILTSERPPHIRAIRVSRETYEDLYRASVEACEAIYRSARSWREDGEEWKRDLTMLDVARVFEALETVLDGSGMGVRIAV